MRLRELIAEKDMTLYQVAKAVVPLGVSEQAVYRLARAKNGPKRIDTRLICALCDVFGVEPGELFVCEAPTRRR